MAQIKIELSAQLVDGMDVKFKAPCDCTEITGLLVEYVSPTGALASKAFTFRDSHGYNLTGLGNLFCAGAYVKAMLDVKNGHAYLQNTGASAFGATVELSAEGWQANSQTVAVPGVKAGSFVYVSANPASYDAYCEAGVRCTGQENGALTFTCEDIPDGDVFANVAILT